MKHERARILLLLLALGCEPAAGPKAPHAAGPAVPLVQNVFGMPGPWWRSAGTPDEFEDDLRACKRVSTRARERAAGSDPLDAAYRAFLTCMTGRGWERGIPPQAATRTPTLRSNIPGPPRSNPA